MGKAPQGGGSSDELAAIGELLAALAQALVAGTPEEITALARLLEQRANELQPTTADAARLAAIATLRERAASLVQTLFVTTDRFLARAMEVQARGQSYRPRPGALPSGTSIGNGTAASLADYRNSLSDLRA
ncbi:hypothetical protein OO015_10715 [Thermomicrobium sp. 4228-Ro]|uniref:hypothetical protein n=1 Tax=Thermomicrobium sp. 4228-Ro TaxID=2993937 RepID=UPI0022490AF6|nr:hypothetical protein [Thermomicrobium sp. 4228-Ro]MCX2727961.1 hypothetical protein [Thermomicrobium sp. 4228-Ro]